MLKESAVAVVFGGDSAERDVSIITGTLCANLLKERRFVVPVFIDVDMRAYTSPEMFSPDTFKNKELSSFARVVFADGALYAFPKKRRGDGRRDKLSLICPVECILNCCHGGECEGGAIAALAKKENIPIASPDMYSSALSMDKALSKSVAESRGVPVVNGFTAVKGEYSKEDILALAERIGYPAIVKPARAGSSIGVSVAENGEELIAAINKAFLIGGKAIIEKYLEDKKDVSCAVYEDGGGLHISEALITYSGGGVFGFEEKYSGSEKENEILSGEVGETAKDYSARIYKAFSLSGMIRIDFILSGGIVYFGEVNSVPGSLCYGFFTKRFSRQRGILDGIIAYSILCGGKEKDKKIIEDILNKNKKISLSCCKL